MGVVALLTGLVAGMPGRAQDRPGATASPPGTVVVDGSSTVGPLTSAVAEEFRKTAQGRNVRITVGISGTGGGFKKFCADSPQSRTDIQDASRPIRPEEDEACRRHQVSYVEVPVAIDGLSVVVHPRNTWATCLTLGELKQMWEPEAERKITSWRQIRPTFPDRPLRLAGAGADSGTFDSFTEMVVGRAKASRGDYLATEDDNVTVQFVGRDEGALGYFGLAYLEENLGRVKGVAIDPGAGAGLTSNDQCRGIEPTFDNTKSGRYPLTRPLFIYLNRTSALTRPEVREFARWYVGAGTGVNLQVDDPRQRGKKTSLTRAVGYVEFPDAVYAAARQCVTRLRPGTAFREGGQAAGHATLDRVSTEYVAHCR
ncbi:MAG: PstS family phosphate ABC transporter substrate-binding protein [Armatimonadota bacterium]|nr:PstS family phosphate ABC transporter substrate-binding protein [Armatimonadota bacterium]MDR7436216.1 PstS family phosphate ABC transporter substrate-binding protein [Armatimonadota bacterium]MDR7471403.1 PstS family phosphate ABC transporter substrate-binding protein [Armatimonadota bacterium]MDR7507178.1 PstS family phosphate ABC transporter substrate-binding protein [Armatimonadota bacterium]MDR7509542.1 PstS family phosphate ABC transporter substrate-binding protein [Armatimonadota bact